MKILKIEQNKGYIAANITKEISYKRVEDVDKNIILEILDYAINNEIEMDEVTKENDLPNPVQKTIYESLYFQFNDFLANKAQIIDEVNAKFKAAELKYLSENRGN